MKKLILSAAIVLGSLSTYAQTATATKTVKTTQTVQEKYTEVKLDAVPEVIIASVKKAYPTAVIDKVYINEKKEYKLDVTVDQKVGTLYADETGNWIKK